MQSAYRRFHSTETAVTKVVNNLLLAADSGQMSALCLLDLTAAFDTVDHELLISRLERQFGLRGVVLEWFRSSGRTFRVVFSGSTSSIIYIVCSVPQGSVLGPLFFHCPDSGPCSYSEEARRISTRVCRRHAAVSTLSSHRHGVSCCTAGTVHHRYRPLDVFQPPQAQRGQN